MHLRSYGIDMSTTQEETSPVVCTLVDGDLVESVANGDAPAAVAEWSDLIDLQLSAEHIPGGAASIYPLAIADQIEALATREGQCCGTWLTANTTRLADTVRLELTTANADGIELIVAMSGLARDS